ncbi:MAG: GNAT family N-acetyltransferase [Ginsengibacter sp.]
MKKLNAHTKIITARLCLKTVSEQYKFDICKEFTPGVTRYMPFLPVGDIRDTETFIERSQQELIQGTAIHFCIVEKTSGDFLGCCGLHDIDKKEVEIGLWLKKSAHGQGYGTETVKALIDLVEKNFVVNYIYYPVDVSNTQSRRIPEKLGFAEEKFYDKKKSETDILHIVEYRKKYKYLY